MAENAGWNGIDYDATGSIALEELIELGEELTSVFQDGFLLEIDGGVFVVHHSASGPSGYRLVCQGVFQRKGFKDVDAVAYVYLSSDPRFYSADILSLSLNSRLGIGPELYGSGSVQPAGRYVLPFAIVENVGVPLGRYLASPAYLSLGKEETDFVNHKVMFDVMTQLWNMHRAGVYHCDLKESNICVRWRAGGDCRDVRATIVDYDSSNRGPGTIPGVYHSTYKKLLFEEIPSAVSCPSCPQPSPLELDMACFEKLRHDLFHPGAQYRGNPVAQGLLPGAVFEYGKCGVFAREFDVEADIKPLAVQLGLETVEERYSDELLIRFANERCHHCGFMDWRDVEVVEQSGEYLMSVSADLVAREVFSFYNAVLERTSGRVPEYQSFEAQPERLQRDNYALARRLISYIGRVGYEVVPRSSVDDGYSCERVLTERQVDYLAQLEHEDWCRRRKEDGIVYGPERTAKTHPLIKSWAELEDGDKKLNRELMREAPLWLERAGLALVVPGER